MRTSKLRLAVSVVERMFDIIELRTGILNFIGKSPIGQLNLP